MDYSTTMLKAIKLVMDQHKHGYHISQNDYNNFLDALEFLNKLKVTVAKEIE